MATDPPPPISFTLEKFVWSVHDYVLEYETNYYTEK